MCYMLNKHKILVEVGELKYLNPSSSPLSN